MYVEFHAGHQHFITPSRRQRRQYTASMACHNYASLSQFVAEYTSQSVPENIDE